MSTPVDEFAILLGKRPPVAQPSWAAPPRSLPVRVGLRAFMVLLVYCAGAFLAGRAGWESGSGLAWTFLGTWIGLGICYLGIWLLARLGEVAVLGWLLIFLGQAVVCFSILPIPLAIPAVASFAGVVIYLRIQHRRSQQAGLLWVLALASDRGVPLAPGVEAYAQQYRGTYRERAHTLASLLSWGEPLAESLEAVPKVVPHDAPILARVGEQTGRLPQALRTAAEVRARRHHALRDVLGRIVYLIGVLNIMLGIVISVNQFILPKYAAILADFRVEMSPMTTHLIDGATFVEDYNAWLARGLMLVLAYLSVSLSLRGWAGLPVVGRLFRLRHRALILRCLALAVEAGQPIDPTVTLLARHYPSRPVRRRLRRADEQMARGVAWTEALRSARLVRRAEADVLDAAARTGNLAWALVALADSGERRFAYRLQFATQVLFVLALLALAVLILFVALALYLPLVALIEGLAE